MSEAVDYFVQSHHSTVEGTQAPLSTSAGRHLLEYNAFLPTVDTLFDLSRRPTTTHEADDTQILPEHELNNYTWSELMGSYTQIVQPYLSTTDRDVHSASQSVLYFPEAIADPNPSIALVPGAPTSRTTSQPVHDTLLYTRKPIPDAYFRQASLGTKLVSTNSETPAIKVKRRRRRKPPLPPEEAAAKRTAFLQRNRDAASKCREKKKNQIKELENEERMGQQINQVFKDELRKVLEEIAELRKQVQESPCEEDCEGCGQHAPQRRDKVVVGTTSLLSTNMFPEREGGMDDNDQQMKTSMTTSSSC